MLCVYTCENHNVTTLIGVVICQLNYDVQAPSHDDWLGST